MRVFFLPLTFAFNTYASENCEPTEEYKSARSEVAKIIYGSDNDYKKCQNAAYKTEYWIALSKCQENDDGKNIGGGCAHLVGRGKYLKSPNTSHYEVFKFNPTPELAKDLLAETVKNMNIIKCKKQKHITSGVSCV